MCRVDGVSTRPRNRDGVVRSRRDNATHSERQGRDEETPRNATQDDPREYVHRVGRTARGETGTGRALLFLAPAELGFLRWLRDARVALHEYEFDMSKVTNIQSALTKLVEKNYYLHRAARDAYRSYLLAYASHAHKDIFDVHALDLQAVSESFGFAVPPRVDLNLSHRGDKKTRRNPKKGDRRKGQSGHAFSAANPYGTKSAGDARQFSY